MKFSFKVRNLNRLRGRSIMWNCYVDEEEVTCLDCLNEYKVITNFGVPIFDGDYIQFISPKGNASTSFRVYQVEDLMIRYNVRFKTNGINVRQSYICVDGDTLTGNRLSAFIRKFGYKNTNEFIKSISCRFKSERERFVGLIVSLHNEEHKAKVKGCAE